MKYADKFNNIYWLDDKNQIQLRLAEKPKKGGQLRNLGPVKCGTWIVKRDASLMFLNQYYSLSEYVIKNASDFGIYLMDCTLETPDGEWVKFTTTPQEWLKLGTLRHMKKWNYEPQIDLRIDKTKELMGCVHASLNG